MGINWHDGADALMIDLDTDRPTEMFYVLTVEGGIHPALNGPYPSATATLIAWTRLHGAQDPETDAAFVLAVNTATGVLSIV